MAGIAIGWDNTNPENTDAAGNGALEIRSLKTNLQAGLDAEHIWPIAGGSSGAHRYGSARPYFGTRSLVSSDGTDGRLMVDSDGFGLWYLPGSGSPMPIGGRSVFLNYNASNGIRNATAPAANVVQYGQSVVTNGSLVVTFAGSGFSGVPVTTASFCNIATPSTGGLINLECLSTTSFRILCTDSNGATLSTSSLTINWQSFGTASAGV